METTASHHGSRATLPIVLGLLAVATAVPAWVLPAFNANTTQATASAEGGVLGRAGVAADQITSLRVVDWNETALSSRVFEVKKEGDRWTIPSAFGYPADGNTRVSRTAAGILGAKLGRLVDVKPDGYAAIGLNDPMQNEASVTTGFGRRVTLKDNTGAEVLDVIVGNKAEGTNGLTFVREVGKSEVWTAKVESDLSTKFTDYVELDPFKLQKDTVRSVAVVPYKVDPDKGHIEPGVLTRFARTAAEGDWSSEQAPADKKITRSKVDDLLSDIANLKLQGVHQFHRLLLEKAGFYLINRPEAFQVPNVLTVQVEGKPSALFGTEGRLDVTTNDGLRYSLMFGKIALSDELEVNSTAAKTDDKKGKPAEGGNRYLAVFVTYDASLDEEAKAAANTEGDKKDTAKPAKKKLSGRDRAAKAQERYQRYFYVISDADFKKLRPDVATFFEDKPKEPMAGKTGKTVKQWMADNAALPGITTLPSGLQYQVITSGPADGPKATTADRVQVAYKGTLVDGDQFDANEQTEFAVTGVIKGWTEALQLMKPGDSWKLFIPPELGYGDTGSAPKIGPNQPLIFEVTLKSVVGKTAAPKAEPKPDAKPADPAKVEATPPK